MKQRRFSDAQIARMLRAAAALRDVMDDPDAGYLDFLFGKWAVLTDDVRREHALRDAERAAMFVEPRVQLLNLMRWNAARGWGFTDDDIDDLAREIPPPPEAPADGKLQLKARVLEIGLPDGRDGAPGIRRTFDELMAILVAEQGFRPCHLFGLAPDVRLALAPGQTHRPGLGWRIIDLGHGWPEPDPNCARLCGTSPIKLPPGTERPHAGLLAAAAHFPLWIARMDGRIVPRVWLPGYELPGVPHALGHLGIRRLAHHPRLSHDGNAPFLYYGWDHVPFDDHAVPIYAETKTDP